MTKFRIIGWGFFCLIMITSLTIFGITWLAHLELPLVPVLIILGVSAPIFASCMFMVERGHDYKKACKLSDSTVMIILFCSIHILFATVVVMHQEPRAAIMQLIVFLAPLIFRSSDIVKEYFKVRLNRINRAYDEAEQLTGDANPS